MAVAVGSHPHGARRSRTSARADTGPALLPVPLARALALLALATAGVTRWMGLLEPAAPGRGWRAVGIGVLAAVALLLARSTVRRELRWAAAGTIALAAFGLALLAAGVADENLRPDRWDTLAAGIGRGLTTLPGARVPFRGLDEWTRAVIAMGGTLLVVVAVALAFWPRSRGRLGYRVPALAAMVALYVVPTVALALPGRAVSGTLLLLGVLAFLRLERLPRRDARGAGLVALGAAVLALAVAPALDRQTPWWDYETWALEAASSKTTAFSWDHDYGPLDWPRDGRELLRVQARRDAYWKAENLDEFDGSRWRRTFSSPAPDRQIPPFMADPDADRKWRQRIRVGVRNLKSREVITAGSPLDVNLRPRGAVPAAPGVRIALGRPLQRGDTYTAEVYVPKPTQAQMRAAGTDYEFWTMEYRTIGLGGASAVPGAGARVRFPAFDDAGEPETVDLRTPSYPEPEPAAATLAGSSVRRTWDLARRLRAASSTPYAYVRRVQSYLAADAFSYTETPPRSAETLDGFLFEARAGFCQQYSGAMALLLRMGGVPARVSTGFTAGSFDRETREFVVRDLDAHSWVEAWFPGYGWVTFDPTPSTAPPRSQADDVASIPGSVVAGDAPNLPGGGPDGRTALADEPSGPPWALLGAGALAVVAAAGLWLLRGVRVRRARAGDERPALVELERALRRAGRDPEPGATLHALEARFAGSPGAAGYVRALREQRYGSGGGGPTPVQRRGLRAELARGKGLRGRLRAWWALPPQLTSPGGRRFPAGVRRAMSSSASRRGPR